MNSKSRILANYTRTLTDFVIHENIDGNYQNMGAIIIDGILQAGIKYETTVRPRVKKYLTDYPEIKTSSAFANLISRVPISTLINWKPSAKTERIEKLTSFLVSIGIESQESFSEWLSDESNILLFKKLPGVGDKTADYFKILVGHQTNAIDRHLLNFIKKAGLCHVTIMKLKG